MATGKGNLPNPNMAFTPFDILLAAELNDFVENIEALATGAGIGDGSVGTSDIADGAVTFAKSDGKFGWEEIGRTILTVAGDSITVNSLPSRKYLMIVARSTATGGTINNYIRFNNDTGNNYAERYIEDGVSGTTASQPFVLLTGATTTADGFIEAYIRNEATKEKQILFQGSRFPSGAANSPAGFRTGVGKWANTANAISRIDIFNAGPGDFAIGSELIVFGRN